MIHGAVNAAYEAVVRLTVQGPSGQAREIEAVVDTGYNGFLTLPPALVTELGLVYRDRGRAILADGSEALFDIYDVAVLWDNRLRNTRASAPLTPPRLSVCGYSIATACTWKLRMAAASSFRLESS